MAPRGRSPRIDVKGGAKGVEHATREAEGALTRLQKHSKESFGHLTRHALGYGAALVGGAGVVGGLEAVAGASIAAEKSEASLEAQLKRVGIRYEAHKKQIADVIAKTSQYSGFLDKDLEAALTSIVRSTGNLHDSYRLLGLATDVARAKGIDVASAGALVAKVQAGQTRVLKSLGIAMDPVTKAQDRLKESTKHATDEQKRAAVAEDKRATAQKALGLLQSKLGGQAKAYGDTTAGSLDKMKAAVDRLEVKLGNALAPTIRKVADKLSTFVTQMQTGEGAGGRFAAKMKTVAEDVGRVLKVVKDVAGWLKQHPALLATAGAAWVTYKTAALAQMAYVKAAELGLFGGATRAKVVGEAGTTGRLAGVAFKAGLIATVTVGLYQALVDPFNKVLGDLGLAVDASDPTHGKAQQRADQQAAKNKNRPIVGWRPAPGGGVTPVYGKARVPKVPSLRRIPKGVPHPHVRRGRSSSVAGAAARASAFAGGRPFAQAAAGSVTGDTAGLDPELMRRLMAMSAGTGVPISITMGFRTHQEQAQLVKEKGVWSPSNQTGAAPVGSSLHERGLAADIQPGRDRFGSVAARYGLVFPIGAEPWHVQMSGTSSAAVGAPAAGAKPKQPPAGYTAVKGLGNVAVEQVAAISYDSFYSPQLDDLDLQAQAGVISPVGAYERKRKVLKTAIKSLSGKGRLQAMAALGQLEKPERQAPFAQTLESPWLQAYLTKQDNLAAAGRLSPDQANQNKVDELGRAIKGGLSGDDVLVAQGMIKQLTPEQPGALSDEQTRLDAIELHRRAGDLSDEQARQRAIASVKDALTSSSLTDDERLQLRAQLGDLQGSGDGLAAIGNKLSDLDLHVRAGDESDVQGAKDKIAAIQDAIAHPEKYSIDSATSEGQHALLELRAQLGDLQKSIDGLDEHVQQQLELAKQDVELKARIAATMSSEASSFANALADFVSGQIFGAYQTRALTAGAGTVARF